MKRFSKRSRFGLFGQTNFKNILNTIFQVMFPSDCDGCGKVLKSNDYMRMCLRCVVKLDNTLDVVTKSGGGGICDFCYSSLIKMRNHFYCPSCCLKDNELVRLKGFLKQNISLFFNQGAAQDLVYGYKFERRRSYAKIISDWSLRKHRGLFESIEVIVPIRLGRRGLYERDFCPVDEVVNRITRLTGIPVVRALKRNEGKYKQAQHKKTAMERKKIEGKYYYLQKYRGKLAGMKILLVDDIFTTGVTLNYVAGLIVENNLENGHLSCEVVGYTFLKSLLDIKLKSKN